MARRALEDALYWLQNCTKTQDEQDLENPFKSFPLWEFWEPLFDVLDHEPVTFLPKSRTMMASWGVTGWASHKVFKRPATSCIIQSKDEDRAIHNVRYAKTLWEQSITPLRNRWTLERELVDQAQKSLKLANKSWVLGIVGDPDKIRSEHPTIVILDEAAHMPDGLESYSVAMHSKCKHLVALSSANPGWFDDLLQDAVPCDWPEYRDSKYRVRKKHYQAGVMTPVPGMWFARLPGGQAVVYLHYTARPDMTPEVVAAEKKKSISEAYWKKEMEMKADALAGQLIFPEFDIAKHVIADDQIPRRGCRYMAIDPHPRTPHAFLWVLIDGWDDWYIYREYWPSVAYGKSMKVTDSTDEKRFLVREYAEFVAWIEKNRIDWRDAQTANERGIYSAQAGGEKIIRRYMDQAGKGFLVSGENQVMEDQARRYKRCGISCLDPIKSHEAGEDAIRAMLSDRTHDTKGSWPKLHIGASCRELVFEMQKYRYQTLSTHRLETDELKQEGVKLRTHMLDLLRYLATARLRHVAHMES